MFYHLQALAETQLVHVKRMDFLKDQSLFDEKTNTFIFCDNYGQAGAINYYSRHKNLRAVSMNADYIHWIPLDLEIKYMILVKDKWDTDKSREKEKPYFHTVDFVGEIENPYSREEGAGIYLMKDAKISISDILWKEIKKRISFDHYNNLENKEDEASTSQIFPT